MSYTSCLPAWSVGPDCYQDVFATARRFGKTAAVIGGKTALSKAYEPLKAALAGSEFTLSQPIWYGGNSTYEHAGALEQLPEVQQADMIFAVGGGRAIDTCKAVAQHLDKPLLTFPTIASNCAACTAIGVFYNADDTFCDYFYPTRCPEHTFINTRIIAEAPESLLWAGIGDALSKECEVELASRGKDLFHTTLLGTMLAHTCTEPLLNYGATAMQQCRENTPGTELEQVALAIVISTGLVSNLTTDPTKYYYNSSLAHCVYYGATMLPASGGKHLHGEIVSFGVLTLLTLGRPVSLVLCELAMGGVVLVMTCILPMDERFIASPMAIARMLRDPEQLAEWLYFARMKANGGVEVTDVSIENIPQPATVKTCQDAICVFQRAQIALMVQCDAQKAYGLMKQVLESEVRLSYTAWKLLLSDGVVAELLAGEPGEFTALYRGKAGAAIRQVMFRMVDYALPAYAVAMLVTHEAREAEVVRNTLAPVREKMPELDALMKAIEEKAARIES